MKSLLLAGLFLFTVTGNSMARTATTNKKIKQESQVHATKGDIGEKAIEKEESLKVPTPKDEILKTENEIIRKKSPNP